MAYGGGSASALAVPEGICCLRSQPPNWWRGGHPFAWAIRSAWHGMRPINRPGFNMSKLGVHLMDLQDEEVEQCEPDLDGGIEARGALMTAVDTPDQRFGQSTIGMASADTAGGWHNWVMKQERKTPDYTTCWKSMPLVHA